MSLIDVESDNEANDIRARPFYQEDLLRYTTAGGPWSIVNGIVKTRSGSSQRDEATELTRRQKHPSYRQHIQSSGQPDG